MVVGILVTIPDGVVQNVISGKEVLEEVIPIRIYKVVRKQVLSKDCKSCLEELL